MNKNIIKSNKYKSDEILAKYSAIIRDTTFITKIKINLCY